MNRLGASSLSRLASFGDSRQLNVQGSRLAGTSSSWSMSRLWNNMKKGLGGNKALVEAKLRTPETQPSNSVVGTEAKSKANQIWAPVFKAFSQEETQKFIVETPMFRCSQQKLSDLARQLCGLPLDAAILQAKFSPKKASEVLYQTLAQALSMAKARNKSPSEYIIKEAITGRGKYMKRLDIKGRGRCGVICRPHAFMRFVMAIPDERKELAKLLKIRHFPHEHKPSYVKLDY